MRVHVSGAQYSLLKTNKFVFREVRSKDIFFLKRRKNHFKMFLEMCMVQHAQTKSVITFQPTKILVFTSLQSAKPALTSLIFLLRTKNRQLLFGGDATHHVT